MERFDAIVVGAGPAGSTAAFRLARTGARVLLLDRERFPRDKPCGGGLTYRAVRQLPFPVDAVVEDVVHRFELGFRYGPRFERGSKGPLILMTQRRRLDAHLAEQAAAAGADFRDGLRATALEPEPSEAVVRFDGGAAVAPVVIGADGVNGLAARTLGVGPRRHGVALEGNVSYVHAREERWRGRAVVELGAVPGGYAWVFPKGDHVNVGVGGWESEGPRLREHLERACAAYHLPSEQLAGLRGYRLPMRRPGESAHRGRVMLVGDAAGLVDPLSGDGIYEALVSARLAAETALDLLAGRRPSLEHYGASLDAALGRALAASWKAKLALERFPRLVYEVVRLPLVWGFTAAFLRGDVAHPGEAQGLVRAPLKLVDALGR
ncbi:MAG: geranylgeranyl reductase family protein [Gaiellaceae bacterium]